MMATAMVLMTIPLVTTIWFTLTVTPQHFALKWPTHAQHHLVSDMSVSIGICVIALILVFGPLRDHQSWSLWALLIAGLANFGSYWLGNLTTGLGEVDAGVRNATWGSIDWNPGEMVLVDNAWVMHGRRPFLDKKRQLVARFGSETQADL